MARLPKFRDSVIGLTWPSIVDKMINFFAIGGLSFGQIARGEGLSTDNCFMNTFDFETEPVDKNDVYNVLNALVDAGLLTRGVKVSRRGMTGQSYYTYDSDLEKLKHEAKVAIFGFQYVYSAYSESVLPICHVVDGLERSGTGFVVDNRQVITARHCIEGADILKIRGLSPNQINGLKIFFHRNENIDLAIIVLPEDINRVLKIEFGQPAMLEDIIAMGYPAVPLLGQFTVAAKGYIAAIEREYMTNNEVILIDGNVRGGFSGGPIISGDGKCLGVVTHASSMAQSSSGELTDGDRGFALATSNQYVYEMRSSLHHKNRNYICRVDMAKTNIFEYI